MDISDLLQGPMKDIILGQIGNQLGLEDKQQTNTAVDGILGTLLNGIQNNASTQEGQASLENALNKDHNGSIFDDLTGFLTGNSASVSAATSNGAGILKHILGDKQESTVDSISKASGIDSGKILKMMMTLAPLVLGMLGKSNAQAQNQSQQSGGGILDIIKGATQSVNQQSTTQSIFNKILDKNGDGNVIDDIASAGMKSIFGKLFGK
ncbi:MAG TPA: DUF937 domain-containing protein [Saprospiraceae bacterium]|jgi:hypothetical protein|nr:DUF937 domain-containing protein [Saprospiraceae bacterium]HRO08478.1 DUF937 domain-containing protein [Saprospiraceae bacterium]HRP41863.1 DUF937 domain-containing protein [Saprospiraceae bacterium]